MMQATPVTQQNNSGEEFHLATRWAAQFFSYLFHPLFIPLYMTLFLEYVHPSYFTGFSNYEKGNILIQIGMNTIFYPVITLLLLKGLKFIDSLFLRTQKDRIIPYISSSIFFFWAFFAIHGQDFIPPVLVAFVFGIFLAASAALTFNIYFKISMHAIGMGGVIGLFFVIQNSNTMLMTWPLSLAFLITGIVCTSRMILHEHRPKEIYWGIILGMVSQFVGAAMFGG